MCKREKFGELPYFRGNRIVGSNFLCYDNRIKHFEILMPDSRHLRSGEPTDTLTEKMAEAVKIARQNKEWRSEYMRASLFEYDCIEEGKAIEHVHTVEAEKRAEKTCLGAVSSVRRMG